MDWEEKDLKALHDMAETRNDVDDWLCLLAAQMTVLLKRVNELVEETRQVREALNGSRRGRE